MNQLQEIISIIYTVLTVLIVLSQYLYKENTPTTPLRLITRISMLIFTIYIVSSSDFSFLNPFLITMAFLLTVIADFFFAAQKSIHGVVFFIFTYITLFLTFNPTGDFQHKLYLIPFLVIFSGMFFYLRHYEHRKIIQAGALIFGLSLSAAAWALVTTSYRGFSPCVSTMTFVSGILLFISDMFVAYSMRFNQKFICWLENTIWITYMIGWTLLMLVIADNSILTI